MSVSTRGRPLLGLIVTGWVGAMIAVWQTAPPHVDGPYTQTMARHIYAGFALFLLGLVAIPLVVWLVDRRQRQPRELPWRLILLLGAVLAFAIGAVGIGVAVHPENRTGTYTQRRDSTLDRYGLAALAVVLVTGVATLRTTPRRQAGATTIPAPRAHPDR
jgi:MFS family permease